MRSLTITLREVENWAILFRFHGRRDVWAIHRRCRQENANRVRPHRTANELEARRRKAYASTVFGF